jgi:hypothetical protein
MIILYHPYELNVVVFTFCPKLEAIYFVRSGVEEGKDTLTRGLGCLRWVDPRCLSSPPPTSLLSCTTTINHQPPHNNTPQLVISLSRLNEPPIEGVLTLHRTAGRPHMAARCYSTSNKIQPPVSRQASSQLPISATFCFPGCSCPIATYLDPVF